MIFINTKNEQVMRVFRSHHTLAEVLARGIHYRLDTLLGKCLLRQKKMADDVYNRRPFIPLVTLEVASQTAIGQLHCYI